MVCAIKADKFVYVITSESGLSWVTREWCSYDGMLFSIMSKLCRQKRERGLMALTPQHAVYAIGLLSTPSGVRDYGLQVAQVIIGT